MSGDLPGLKINNQNLYLKKLYKTNIAGFQADVEQRLPTSGFLTFVEVLVTFDLHSRLPDHYQH